jgi:GNAT superfamily N-acetyltransferase
MTPHDEKAAILTTLAYEALWSETDAARRAELIVHCLDEDVEIVGPGYLVRGHPAVEEHVARFQRAQPGSRPKLASGIDAHSGWARFAVTVEAPDGAVIARGLDIVEFGRDQRIRRLIAFLGALPPLELEPARAPTADSGSLAFETHDDVPADLARIVDDGLGADNERAAPMEDVHPLACFARDASGAAIGGAIGRTWGECCQLQQLWVAAPARGADVGTRLVRRFEEHACARGCRTFYLDTFSFQAPAFYRKLGYEPVLAIEGFTRGIVFYSMMKRLDPRT